MTTRGDHDLRRRARFGTLLVLISLVLSVVFAFVPAKFDSSTISWRPDSFQDSGSLQLTRGAPERMSVETTCDLARTLPDTETSLLSTGSLELSAVDDAVQVQTAPTGPTAKVALPPGDCTVVATYTLDPSRLKLTVDDVSDEVAVAAPVIFGLYTSDPPTVSGVEILTQETGLAPSWMRWTIGQVALALLLVGAVLLWLPTRRPRDDRRGWKAFVPRLAPVDGFVTIGVVGLALITPPLIDDGWIFGRSGVLRHRWWFGDLFGAQDAWLPQGTLHELVLTALQSAGLELAQVRVLVGLLVALTWIVLRLGVLAPALGEAASRWPAAAATYVAFAGAWLISVRQEPTVLFLAVLALTVAISAERSTRPGWVCAGLLAAGLALTTHQTGWVAAAPAAVILWSVGVEIRRDRSRALPLLTAVLAAVSGLVLAAFAAADLHTVIEGARTLSQGSHGAGPLDELTRYTRLFGGAGGRVATLFLLLVWCLAGSLGINAADLRSKRLWTLCMLWLGGLLLSASKWEWHFAVYAVPAAGLAALAGVELRRRDRATVLGTGAVLAMIGLAAGVGMTAAGGWNLRDLSTRTWPELTELVVGEPHRIYWYVGLVALIALGLLADHRRGRWQPAALTTLCLVILFPIGASMAWLAADAAEPGWSPTGANLRQLTDRNACGVLDGLDIDVDVEPLEMRQGEGDNIPLIRDAFPGVDRISTGPLGGGVPVWGTWAADKKTSADARAGLFQSPSFEVGDAREITIWSAFGSAELLYAKAIFTDSSGAESATTITPDAGARWARLHLSVPEGAVEFRVDVDDQNTGYGGWLAVSSPVVSSDSSVSSVLDGSSAYANPLEATLVPCVDLPDVSRGYWGKVDYVASEGWAFETKNLRGLTVTEVACRPTVICLQKIDYSMADVVVTPTP